MINVLKNEQGLIYAYIEWSVLDESFHYAEDGRYVYIWDLWIHPDFTRLENFRKLIELIADDRRSWASEIVYWKRGKYDERRRVYSKNQFIRKWVQNGRR